jgi:hypothetical protein
MKIHKQESGQVVNVGKSKTKCGRMIFWHGLDREFDPLVSPDWNQVTCKACLNKKRST